MDEKSLRPKRKTGVVGDRIQYAEFENRPGEVYFKTKEEGDGRATRKLLSTAAMFPLPAPPPVVFAEAVTDDKIPQYVYSGTEAVPVCSVAAQVGDGTDFSTEALAPPTVRTRGEIRYKAVCHVYSDVGPALAAASARFPLKQGAGGWETYGPYTEPDIRETEFLMKVVVEFISLPNYLNRWTS